MKERVGKLGSLALGASIVLSACGGEKPITKPTQVPTEKPTPTLSTPTPEASATPIITTTPEPTPTLEPTPEATPELLDMASIVDGKHNAVKFTKVKTDIEKAYIENPQAKSFYPYGVANLDSCKTGDNDPNPKIKQINREAYCGIFVANSYKAYKQTGDMNFYIASKDGYNYAISSNGLGIKYKDNLDNFLKEVGLLE